MKSVRTIFSSLELLTLGLAIVFTAILFLAMRHTIRDNHIVQQGASLNHIAATVKDFIKENSEDFSILTNPENSNMAHLFPGFSDVYYASAQGIIIRILKQERGSTIFTGFDLSQTALGNELHRITAGSTVFLPLIRSHENDRMSIYFMSRNREGILIARIGMDTIREYLRRSAESQNSIITLSTRDGFLLASTHEPLPFYTLTLANGDTVSIEGSEHLCITQWNEFLNCSLSIFTPLKSVYQLLNRMVLLFLIFMAVVSCFTIFKIIRESRIVIHPIELLTDFVRQWTHERVPHPIPDSALRYREITMLYQHMRNTTDQITAAHRDVSASEAKFRAVLLSMDDIVLGFDDTGIVVFSNAAASASTLITPDPVGKPYSAILPDSLAATMRETLARLIPGQSTEFDYEQVDESQHRWFSIRISPNRDRTGQRGSIAVIRDVSGRKLAEENALRNAREKEILLREIHHRVKNNLAIINSLLSLQSEAPLSVEQVREVFRESRNRVRTMALIHEKLYQASDLSRINIRAYTEQMVQQIIDSYNITTFITVNTDITLQELNINSAIPCGLIINELISNAVKHAFNGRDRGMIRCTLTRRDAGMILLSVEDNGIGLPVDFTIERTTSLGMRLVQALVQQLKGTLTIERTAGTRVSISFPE